MMNISPRTYANATMYVGLVATLGGNAAAADWSDPLAVVISAFPALGLMLTFEMISRGKTLPSRRTRTHRLMRTVPAVSIMGIAAYASYGHLLQVAQAHGQHGASAYLLAALPDAMMLLATAVLKDTPATRRTARPAAKKAPARKPATRKSTPTPAQAASPRILGPVPTVSPITLATARRTRLAG